MLGVVMTGADLPNAFPYVIAVERLVTAGVTTGTALVALVGYGLVYCVPCLVLLAFGLRRGERVVARLRALFDRFGTEKQLPASPLRALLLAALGVGVLAIAATT